MPSNPNSFEKVKRRTFLSGGAATAATVGLAGLVGQAEASTAPRDHRQDHALRFSYPFTLGVSSGEPTEDGVVLWTRLAPSPVDDDGMGGMPATRSFPVEWQLATDERMSNVIRDGIVDTDPRWAHSVHVELDGLETGREYYYRFRSLGHVSPTGRTRTAPAGLNSSFRIGVASCQSFTGGYYTAHQRMAEDAPDVVLFLGDYIYEHMSDGGIRYVQEQLGPQPVTVAGYRQRYAQYKSDPDLQAAHAVAPWISIIDDHEVHDNWAGDEPREYLEVPGYPYLDQRANAFRAYYEHMPLRSHSRPDGPDIVLSRQLTWGRLASFYALDTRQYRSDHTDDLEEAMDPSRTMTGAQQEKWFLDSTAESASVWNVVLNQAMFVQRDTRAGSEQRFSFDAWDGYMANRQRILNGLAQRSVDNVVVMTGNEHRNYASNILADFRDPSSAVLGSEFVGTSISSGRDGADIDGPGRTHLEENPWIKFTNAQRGYLRVDVDAGLMKVDFRILPYVTERGAPVSTRASYVVEAGKPGIEAA